MGLLALIGAAIAAFVAFIKTYKIGPYLDEETAPGHPLEAPKAPQDESSAPTPPQLPPTQPEPVKSLAFDTPQHAWHSVRVLCDEMGLTYDQKNVICACIFQESRFNNHAIGKNARSTDWGIVQVNDYYHIGKGKTFPSVEYVLSHPEACVKWMIHSYKAGRLGMWVSYSSGAYKQWLRKTSPMWSLAV